MKSRHEMMLSTEALLSTFPLIRLLRLVLVATPSVIICTDAFAAMTSSSSLSLLLPPIRHTLTTPQSKLQLDAKKNVSTTGGGGFGASNSKIAKGKSSRGGGGSYDLISTLNDNHGDQEEEKFSRTFVKTDQEQLLNDLAAKSSRTIIGQAVSKSPDYGQPQMDPFWSLLPSLISTKFPNASDSQLKRVAGMVEFSVGLRDNVIEDDVISNPWRPHDELHAYMPGLGTTEPFLEPDQLDLCRQLSEHYAVILKEYEALYENRFDRNGNDRFQSVTSMNCEIFVISY